MNNEDKKLKVIDDNNYKNQNYNYDDNVNNINFEIIQYLQQICVRIYGHQDHHIIYTNITIT